MLAGRSATGIMLLVAARLLLLPLLLPLLLRLLVANATLAAHAPDTVDVVFMAFGALGIFAYSNQPQCGQAMLASGCRCG